MIEVLGLDFVSQRWNLPHIIKRAIIFIRKNLNSLIINEFFFILNYYI